jgi:hypothetical protein
MTDILDLRLRVKLLIEREHLMGNFDEIEENKNAELKNATDDDAEPIKNEIMVLNVPGKFQYYLTQNSEKSML